MKLLRQRPQRLRKQRALLHPDGQFAHAGHEGRAGDADDIADIELFEHGEGIVADFALADEKLDLARAVLQIRKNRLAHASLGHEPSGNGHDRAELLAFSRCGRVADVADHLRSGKGAAERLDAGFPEFPDLQHALLHQIVHFLLDGAGFGLTGRGGQIFFTHFPACVSDIEKDKMQ